MNLLLRRKHLSSILLDSINGGLCFKLTKAKLAGEKAHNFYKYLLVWEFTEKQTQRGC